MNEKYDKTKSDLEEEKRRRDVNNICRYARFVICVDEHGNIVNIIDRTEWQAAIIAVVLIKDLLFDAYAERVLLEVGFNRTRPYANIEKDGSLFMAKRRVADSFPLHKHAAIERSLFDCIEKVVIEVCARWEKQGDWRVKGGGRIQRGVTFTISRHDEFLSRQMLVLDLKYIWGRNMDKHVRAIKNWIGHYKRVDYSEKQLRGFEGVRKTSELLTTYEERPRHRDALLRAFGRSSKVRMLVDLIVEVFKLDFSAVDPESEIMNKHFTHVNVRHNHVWVHVLKQPKHHAKNALVAEIGVTDQDKIWKKKEELNDYVQSGTGA